MKTILENQLIDIVKEQTQIFLLDAGEFFPFGTVIDKNNHIAPIAAYLNHPSDRPLSQSLIDLLRKDIQAKIDTGDYLMGAFASDITIHKNNKSFDGIAIRIFEPDHELFFKYTIKDNSVIFEVTQ